MENYSIFHETDWIYNIIYISSYVYIIKVKDETKLQVNEILVTTVFIIRHGRKTEFLQL